jgi:hypothetical protein
MPTRLIREGWLESEKINMLDASAERFFLRLCLRADDFGRYHANPILLKSSLFPLIEAVRSTDIPRWLAACEKAGLLRCYSHDGKQFIEIRKFGQRARSQVSKFPNPPPDDGLLPGICLTDVSQMPDNGRHPRPYSDSETYSDSSIAPTAKPAGRVRDVLFDSLAIAEGSDPKQLTAPASKKIGVALAQIRAASPDVGPSEIQARARAYRRLMPTAALTAHALAAHWAKLGNGGRPADEADTEPEGWRAYWRETYPPEDFPDAPRHDEGEWKAIPTDHKKMIVDGMRKRGLL